MPGHGDAGATGGGSEGKDDKWTEVLKGLFFLGDGSIMGRVSRVVIFQCKDCLSGKPKPEKCSESGDDVE